MGQHRDESKSEEAEGRSGSAAPGSTPRSSQASPEGGHPRQDGRALGSAETDDVPAEELTFSQGGGAGSQPGIGKRVATDEDEDMGHLDRGDLDASDPKSSQRNRARGAEKHGARPPG